MAVQFLRGANLVHLVNTSLGSPVFQQLMAVQNGRRLDLVEGGQLACARFVSCLLHITDLLGGHKPFATVIGLHAHLALESPWYPVPFDLSSYPDGSVIFWGPPEDGSTTHRHVGFLIQNGGAVVSHSSETRAPRMFTTVMVKAPVEAIYCHPALVEEV